MADYSPTAWVDDTTDFTAARANKLEAGVQDAAQHHSRVAGLPAAAAANKNWIVENTNDGGLYYSTGSAWINIRRTQEAVARGNVVLTGGGTITFTSGSRLKWTTRFIVMGRGRGTFFTTGGYFDLTMPAVAATIHGHGGTSDGTVDANGILINPWDTLYYELPIGSGSSTDDTHWHLVNFTSDFEIPPNWVLVAQRNDDSPTIAVSLANGLRLRQGDRVQGYSQSQPQFVGNALPSSPSDGQEAYFSPGSPPAGSPNVMWHLIYNASSGKWHYVGGPPLYSEATPEVSTTSTSYTDLAGSTGPTIDIPLAGDYDVSIGYRGYRTGGDAFMSYAIGGTAAVDADGADQFNSSASTIAASHFRKRRKTGLTVVSLTSKYRVDGGTGFFQKRWIEATPVKVG